MVDRSLSLVECVPNFSEGEDRGTIEQIVRAMQVGSVALLDWSMDGDHNRSVVTIAGPPREVCEAAIRGVGKAAELIDLTRQRGVHPRMGAADVVPFVPVRGVTLPQCVALARQAGAAIVERWGVPCYFYEAAALRPDRVRLEDVRRGEFEGLLRDSVHDTRKQPDLGGPALHTTAGASAVGARRFLIAYNIYLDPGKRAADVGLARTIAREVRESGGGLYGLKAMGVVASGRAQVSMNVTDFERTPLSRVHETVHNAAEQHGARIGTGEIIGLIPEAAFEPNAAWTRQIEEFDPEQKVIERRLERPLAWP